MHDLIGREISNLPFLLTFDDGGASAHRYIADILEGFGWYGHFFVTVDYIGNRNFLTEEQIIDLKRRGHVIGTHSCSHPTRMASCSWEDILKEWSQSTRSLSEILGEKVRVASVPGGYYTKIVAEAASKAGIEALFTSEPTMRCHRVDECLVLGRYTVRRGTPPGVAGSLAAGDFEPRIKQWLLWNARKLPKSIGGELYLKMRHFILRNWE
ncbi:MAG: polysaccharide deacetylase family protein [Candidatus Aenigmarchaeota archaeon]|nr:polysaccharide deacetylase family protein [Candidatus Aenigmarchaeota archaeon]